MRGKIDPVVFICSAAALGATAAFFRYCILPIARNVRDRYNAWLYRRIEEMEPWQRRAYLQGRPRQGFEVIPYQAPPADGTTSPSSPAPPTTTSSLPFSS